MKGVLKDAPWCMLRARDKLHHARFLGMMPCPTGRGSSRAETGRGPAKVDSCPLHCQCELRIALHQRQKHFIRLLEMCRSKNTGIRRRLEFRLEGNVLRAAIWPNELDVLDRIGIMKKTVWSCLYSALLLNCLRRLFVFGYPVPCASLPAP